MNLMNEKVEKANGINKQCIKEESQKATESKQGCSTFLEPKFNLNHGLSLAKTNDIKHQLGTRKQTLLGILVGINLAWSFCRAVLTLCATF
jgi:hypothetical protein